MRGKEVVRSNINDFVLMNICPLILNYDDKYTKFAQYLSSPDIDRKLFIDNINAYIAILSYDIILNAVDKFSFDFDDLEHAYNVEIWSIFEQSDENIKTASYGWLRLNKVIREIIGMIKGSDHVASNTIIYSALNHPDRVDYQIRIEVMFVKNKEVNVITFTLNQPPVFMPVISSPKNQVIIEYFLEANIPIGTIYEVVIDMESATKPHSIHHMSLTKNMRDISRHYSNKHVPTSANITMCHGCCYKHKCLTTHVRSSI